MKTKSLQRAAPDQQFCPNKTLYLHPCLKVFSVCWSDSKDSRLTTRVKTSGRQELQVNILGKQAKKGDTSVVLKAWSGDLGDRLSLRPLTFIQDFCTRVRWCLCFCFFLFYWRQQVTFGRRKGPILGTDKRTASYRDVPVTLQSPRKNVTARGQQKQRGEPAARRCGAAACTPPPRTLGSTGRLKPQATAAGALPHPQRHPPPQSSTLPAEDGLSEEPHGRCLSPARPRG